MFHCRFFIYLYKLNLFLSYTWRMCWKSLMFHAFSLLSFRVINVNKFWMISSLEIISFFRNSVYFSRLRMIVLSTIVLCWFTLCQFYFFFRWFYFVQSYMLQCLCPPAELLWCFYIFHCCMRCWSGWNDLWIHYLEILCHLWWKNWSDFRQ